MIKYSEETTVRKWGFVLIHVVKPVLGESEWQQPGTGGCFTEKRKQREIKALYPFHTARAQPTECSLFSINLSR